MLCMNGLLTDQTEIDANAGLQFRRVARNLHWGGGAVLDTGKNNKRSWPRF